MVNTSNHNTLEADGGGGPQVTGPKDYKARPHSRRKAGLVRWLCAEEHASAEDPSPVPGS